LAGGTRNAKRLVMEIAEQLRDRSFRFALRVVLFCRELPRNWEAQQIARQLFRSGTSVAANYRATCRARSGREFIARLRVVAEKCDESLF
jgi:four helix bundle protein